MKAAFAALLLLAVGFWTGYDVGRGVAFKKSIVITEVNTDSQFTTIPPRKPCKPANCVQGK